MGLEKNLLVNELLQKSKLRWFIMGIGGETYMKIGLIDVDGHNFPNLALMRISAYHKRKGVGFI